MAAHYGCSLITVRRALDELARGTDRWTRGRGTFVLHPRMDRDIAGRASFSEEMRQRGLSPETRPVSLAPNRPLWRSPGRWRSRRARRPCIRAAPPRQAASRTSSNRVHLPAEPFPGLLAMDLSTARYMNSCRRATTPRSSAREALEPVLLRAREARLLDQRRGAAALLIEGIAFDADGVPVEFGRTFVRGDRSRYFVERSVDRRIGQTAVEATVRVGGISR